MFQVAFDIRDKYRTKEDMNFVKRGILGLVLMIQIEASQMTSRWLFYALDKLYFYIFFNLKYGYDESLSLYISTRNKNLAPLGYAILNRQVNMVMQLSTLSEMSEIKARVRARGVQYLANDLALKKDL